MSNCFSWAAKAVLLIAVVAGLVSRTHAWPASRLAALTARQDLEDKVRLALALDEGKISICRRAPLLAEAKELMTPNEFEAFRQAINRLSPPPKPIAKRSIALAQQSKKPAPSSFTRAQAMQLSSKASRGPIVPKGAARPDRLAFRNAAR